ATIGVSSAWWAGRIPGAAAAQAWWTWWLGDMLGVLVIASFLLTWSQWPSGKLSWPRIAEAVLLLGGLAVISQSSFGAWHLVWNIPYPVIYLIFIFVFWGALRFGPRGACATVWVVTGLAIWDTVRRMGPFVRARLNLSLFSLDFFIGTLTTTALVIA